MKMKKRILLIDDNDEWRIFAESELERAGFEVIAPNNITEFCSIQNLRSHLIDFNLIIIDAILENEKAIDILYRIKEAGAVENCNYVLSTISVSSRLDIQTVVAHMRMGIQSVSPKAYESQKLISFVQDTLRETEHADQPTAKS